MAAGAASATRRCWQSARKIGSALLERGLSAEKPVVILSGNSIDHAQLAFGALYVGVPYCPVSPPYSLVSKDFGKLGYVIGLLTPGLVFVEDAAPFANAIRAKVPSERRDRGVARRDRRAAR